jgi:hypothetical protein
MTTQTDFDKTGKLYRKIDLWVRKRSGAWVYYATTQQWKTCKAAKTNLSERATVPLDAIKAFYSSK